MENAEVREGVAVNPSATSVQSTMRHLHDELAQLLEQRTAVMRRIAGAKRTIVGLAALFGETALDEELRKLVGMGTAQRLPGLTDMCRTILMEADRDLSLHDVLEGICARNPALLAGHKNPMASLTTILNRLVSSGEAQRLVFNNNNKRAWQWVVAADRPSPSSPPVPSAESPAHPSDEMAQTGKLTG